MCYCYKRIAHLYLKIISDFQIVDLYLSYLDLTSYSIKTLPALVEDYTSIFKTLFITFNLSSCLTLNVPLILASGIFALYKYPSPFF